ncbi:dihydropyrimidinase [Yoonia sediminilitoris]|uniref:Dihydropyrimidinase n=1 Tax=Yoonia sediminilitoris TaxID=1286148 RepID=A0A2T6KHH3_9RHOB|nr:dihydropyrimidinase [Yoonia sediminilitoris]PUB14964.1 dihydropyrimidinase [Yoonia sediminilitoris]RCW95680.1 dihydropyrimidinase [Yoonia sediminilitoris]
MTTFDSVVSGGQVVTPEGVITADVGIKDGKIAAIGTGLIAEKQIDAHGKWVMPGGVDAHAHIEQMSGMGVINADTFETATKSAAMGGTTSVISFAAQAKGQPLAQTVADYSARAQRGAMIDYAFHLTLTDLAVPDFEADLAALIASGHRSLKVFTTYNIKLDDHEILSVMAQARAHGALVCVHPETDAILGHAKAALIAASQTRPKDHAASHPRFAEIDAIGRMCRFADYLDQPVMLFHVSTAEGAAEVAMARAAGVPVWAETCPHYLFMTEDVLDRPGLEGAKWMCSPPQRQAADQQALWQALAAGDLDLVSSDHAPYRYDESGKLSAGPDAGFHQIANGLPGLETRLPLMFDAMMQPGGQGPEMFAQITATAPAQIYGLPGKGVIGEGMDADLVIWDPDKTVTYGPNDLHDNVGYNPWEGRTITGWPAQVMLRGTVICRNGTFDGTPGTGQWINRPVLATRPRHLQEAK